MRVDAPFRAGAREVLRTAHRVVDWTWLPEPDAGLLTEWDPARRWQTRGWAVLLNLAMPIVGAPATMNDTYVEQVAASARSAIDEVDRLGIIDRGRVMIAGHSYGAFMATNLLAHTDLFTAGIALGGAYNRTLTPFGFQTERRAYWEAPDVYHRVSPFLHADRIKAPLLIVHGAADENPGTEALQSERLFDALQGTGGTARLVVLPFEDHVYRARESVLHVIGEMLEWGRAHVSSAMSTMPPQRHLSAPIVIESGTGRAAEGECR